MNDPEGGPVMSRGGIPRSDVAIIGRGDLANEAERAPVAVRLAGRPLLLVMPMSEQPWPSL